MVLIFGGAYQGKLEYALDKFNMTEKDVFHCKEEAALDLSFKVISNLENFVMGCVKEEKEAKELLLEYGGNPNSVERGRKVYGEGLWTETRCTALGAAIGVGCCGKYDFEKVRILV